MAAVSKRTWTYKGETKTAWTVRWRDGADVQRQKTFDFKRDADAYRLKLDNDAAHGLNLKKPPTPLREVARLFGNQIEARYSAGQIGRSRRDALATILNHHVVPYLGATPICDLTPLRIESWVADLARRGNRKTKAGLAPATTMAVVAGMHMLEDFAIKHGYMVRPIMREARKEIGRLRSKPIRVPSHREIHALLDQVRRGAGGQDARSRDMLVCYVYLAVFCGLRAGEISGLRAENVDFAHRVVRVRNNLTHYDELKEPKTHAGVRDVPMAAIVAEALRDWLTRHWVENVRGLAFTTPSGKAIVGCEFNSRWNRLRARAGLGGDDPVHFHALRHFHASVLVEQGVPLTEIARALGHQTFDTTLMVYAHPLRNVDALHPVVERIVAAIPLAPLPARYETGRIIHKKPPACARRAQGATGSIETMT